MERTSVNIREPFTPKTPDPLYYLVIKRLVDITFSLFVLIILLIPGIILSVGIALQSKGSPIYIQKRLGKNGKHFNLYKFRSMVADADNVDKYLSKEQIEQWEFERKVDDDPRITPIGHLIRKGSIDEFPQFLNVLIGDMSVVGPRPIVDEELEAFGDDAQEFLSRRPGITGWWQITARNDATYESGVRQEMELYYIRNASLWLDIQIFFRTFATLFKGTGQ